MPGLDRPARSSSAQMPETADTKYVVPSEGTLFWMDTWVMMADAPHPNATYAWFDFIERARDPGQGDRDHRLRHAQPRGQEAVAAGDAGRPGHLPAGRGHGTSKAPDPRRPTTRSGWRSGPSSSRASAARRPGRVRAMTATTTAARRAGRAAKDGAEAGLLTRPAGPAGRALVPRSCWCCRWPFVVVFSFGEKARNGG